MSDRRYEPKCPECGNWQGHAGDCQTRPDYQSARRAMSDRPPIEITTEGTPEEHAHARAIGEAFRAGQRSRQPSIRPAEPRTEYQEGFHFGYEAGFIKGRAEAAAPAVRWEPGPPGGGPESTRTAEPRTHRRLTVGESGYNGHRGTDSWECACGAWGSHSWMGWAYHLSDLLAEAAAPAGLDVDDWRLLEWARSTVLSLIETAPVVARSKLFNAARSSGYDLDRAIKRRQLQGKREPPPRPLPPMGPGIDR